jgi:glycosyltransferase involved in cell wall biosynthesis
MTLTIFTPAYNRAYRLPMLYESLRKQTNKDFEWLVIDDGSKDNTEELFQEWQHEATFPVRYIKQPNGGKHRAINHGVKEALGDLFFIVDSDDELPINAVEVILSHYEKIKGRKEFGGVCGRRGRSDNSVIGSTDTYTTLECTNFDIREKYHVKGDLSEVFLTSVLREFQFPEIEGERFCPEVLVWNRISTKYIIRYFNEVTYLCEYLPDGLTASIVKVRMQSPVASCMTYQEMTKLPLPFKRKLRAAINYWRFYGYIKPEHLAITPKLSPLWRIVQPIGMLMAWNDRRHISL